MVETSLQRPALSRLRQETHQQHQQLEETANLEDLLSDDPSRATYIQTLKIFAQLHLGWEQLASQRQRDFSQAHPTITRSQAILNDLEELGTARDLRSSLLEQQVDFSWITNESEFAGAVYVIEGSSLGGQVISRHLYMVSGFPISFFAGSGKATGKRWRAVQRYLESHLCTDKKLAMALASAQRTFSLVDSLFRDSKMQI